MKAFQVSIPPCRRCVFQLGILYQAHGSRVLFDYSAVHTVSVPVACVPLCVSPLYKTMFLHAEKEEKHCVYKHAFFFVAPPDYCTDLQDFSIAAPWFSLFSPQHKQYNL